MTTTLERLCRYITRPALSDERVQLNAAGQVELKLKTPWRDGTTLLPASRGRDARKQPVAAVSSWPLWIAIHNGHYEKTPVMRSSGAA